MDPVSPETAKSTSFCLIFYFILFYFVFIYFPYYSPYFNLNSSLIFNFPLFLFDIIVFVLQELLNY